MTTRLNAPQLLAAFVLLLTTALAFADTGHQAWTRATLERLPVAKADRTPERLELRARQLNEFAVAIAEASAKQARPREYAALLVTIGGAESNFDTQIVLGICPKWACDHGKSVGAFQNQNVGFVRDLWSTAAGNPRQQVEMADRVLSRSLTRCAPFASYPAHVFRAYKGGGASSCSWPLPDEARRVATYLRVLSTPMPKVGGTP